MEHKDHITLNLPTSSGLSGSTNDALESSSLLPRRSLRRSWNQLSRCQRNLIFLGTFIIIFTSLLVLQDVETKSKFLRIYSRQTKLEVAAPESLPKLNKEHESNDESSQSTSESSSSKTEDASSSSSDSKPSKSDDAPKGKFPMSEATVLPKKLGSDLPRLPEENERVDINPNINIQELNLNEVAVAFPTVEKKPNNFLDPEMIQTKIREVTADPDRMPAVFGNGPTIQELIDSLESPSDAQKQHFHGATNERQSAVVDAFKHSWRGYRKYAWGHDNLKPISQVGHDWFGLGLTIIDSLDTMYIMGLDDEFQEATEWVREKLNFNVNRDVNLFEVTIRVLGGLLSAYHLSGEKIYLQKSIELGNRLLPSFLTPSGIPYSDVNLGDRSAHSPKWSPDSSTSEVTTIQLEFRDLSRSTNNFLYERVAHNVNEKVHALEKNKGLVPIFINANTGTFRNFATISLGARGDSYYEYLLKQWIQTGRKDDDFLILDYMRSIDGVLTELMRRTPKEHHVFIGELINGKDFKPKMDHLTCYLPGTLILGHHFGMPDSHLLLARDLLDTCYQTYIKNPTGLAPEISYFAVTDNEEQDIYVKPSDAHNLLRPEFIESLYYFYAITGNRTYQDMGWKIFQAFDTHTKVAAGYTSIGNVKNIYNTRLRDMMESFWLGETLKYFYLLFSDSPKEIDLNKWIFNTEAHLLPVRSN